MSNTTSYSVNNSAALANDARIKIAKQIVKLAQYLLRFYDICDYKEMIGSGNSTSVRFIQYPDLNLPGVTITEGADPVGSTLVANKIEATVEQWGDIVAITDVAELTLAHPVMAIAQERLARQAARTIDREIQEVLKASTYVVYGNGVAARANMLNTSILKRTDVQKMVAKLRINGAEPHDGEYYVGVISPSVEQDLNTSNDSFILAHTYASNTAPLFMGEIGRWLGVRWIRSNFMPVLMNGTTASLANGSIADQAGTAGSLAAVAHYAVWVGRAITTGFENIIFAQVSVTPTVNKSIDATAPADTNYVYDLYFGTTSGSTKLINTRLAAGSVTNIKTVVTTGAAVPTAIPNDVKLNTTYIFGKGAFAVADLQNLQFFITKDESMPGNVLRLARYAGWKAMFKAAILENNFMARAESHSDNV